LTQEEQTEVIEAIKDFNRPVMVFVPQSVRQANTEPRKV
jgi:hypothetical protein